MSAIWTKWRVWVAVGVLLIACEPAHAFYWQGWPGSQIPPDRTIIGPPGGTTPDTPQPPDTPIDRPPVGPPTQTPEPTTGLLGLLGVTAVAARRWWKKG